MFFTVNVDLSEDGIGNTPNPIYKVPYTMNIFLYL